MTDKLIPATHPKTKVRPRFDRLSNKVLWYVLCAVQKDKEHCEFNTRRETHNGAHMVAASHRRAHKSA